MQAFLKGDFRRPHALSKAKRNESFGRGQSPRRFLQNDDS